MVVVVVVVVIVEEVNLFSCVCSVMLFIIGLPVVQIILFCLTIGRDPKGLHLAYVNDELNFTTDCVPVEGCSYDLLSCQYLDSVRLKEIVLVSLVAMSEEYGMSS
jgi:hypothetical protein